MNTPPAQLAPGLEHHDHDHGEPREADSPEARREAIDPAEHLGLVRTTVAKFLRRRPGSVHLAEDLFSAGSLAVVEAARTYDPARGPWPPYAITAIRHAIQHESQQLCSGPRGPLRNPWQGPPPAVSLDAPIAPGETMTLLDRLEDAGAPEGDGESPEEQVARAELRARVRELPARAGLKGRRADVVAARWCDPDGDGDVVTGAEVGHRLRCSARRVWQIERETWPDLELAARLLGLAA